MRSTEQILSGHLPQSHLPALFSDVPFCPSEKIVEVHGFLQERRALWVIVGPFKGAENDASGEARELVHMGSIADLSGQA